MQLGPIPLFEVAEGGAPPRSCHEGFWSSFFFFPVVVVAASASVPLFPVLGKFVSDDNVALFSLSPLFSLFLFSLLYCFAKVSPL